MLQTVHKTCGFHCDSQNHEYLTWTYSLGV